MYLSVNHAKIYCSDTGARRGPVVVLLHPFPLSHEIWKNQIELLSQDYRVLAPDYRGLGRSEVGDGQYSIDLMAEDFIGVLDTLGVEKAIWCAASMGGYVALSAYEKSNDRCSGLILCNTKSGSDTEAIRQRRVQSIRDIKKMGLSEFAEGFLKSAFTEKSLQENSPQIQMARDLIKKNSVLGICGVQMALGLRRDLTDLLSSISVPTLVISGDEDKVIVSSESKLLSEKINRADFVMVPKSAHFSFLENSSFFNQNLLSFLKKI